MKRVFFYIAMITFSISMYSCVSSIPQHCPSYHSSYGKETHKKTKGINQNVFDNGIRASRYR